MLKKKKKTQQLLKISHHNYQTNVEINSDATKRLRARTCAKPEQSTTFVFYNTDLHESSPDQRVDKQSWDTFSGFIHCFT